MMTDQMTSAALRRLLRLTDPGAQADECSAEDYNRLYKPKSANDLLRGMDTQRSAGAGTTPKARTEWGEFLLHGGFGLVVAEYRFHPERGWRFDWAVPDQMIAWEYDGIMGGQASHASIANILRDSDKINEAQALGWKVFRVNAKAIGDERAYELAERVMQRVPMEVRS